MTHRPCGHLPPARCQHQLIKDGKKNLRWKVKSYHIGKGESKYKGGQLENTRRKQYLTCIQNWSTKATDRQRYRDPEFLKEVQSGSLQLPAKKLDLWGRRSSARPSSQHLEATEEGSRVWGQPDLLVSSRPAWAPQWELVSKRNQEAAICFHPLLSLVWECDCPPLVIPQQAHISFWIQALGCFFYVHDFTIIPWMHLSSFSTFSRWTASKHSVKTEHLSCSHEHWFSAKLHTSSTGNL